jgi:hypothetical protein
MKTTFCIVLMLSGLFLAFAVASEKPINELIIKIVEVSPSGSIAIEVGNPSKKPIRVWNESNSWGAARWRVLLIRKGQLETFFQNPDQQFTRNGPGFSEIAAESHINKNLDLNGANWLGLNGKAVHFEPGDLVVVIYDVPVTDEGRKLNVWYGISTVSTTVQ